MTILDFQDARKRAPFKLERTQGVVGAETWDFIKWIAYTIPSSTVCHNGW